MILRRYIVRSLVGPFLLGFGVTTFLFTINTLFELLDLLIGKGIPVWTVARLFLFALGWIVALTVPCGVLVAALMTFGRMSQDNEITALRASGVHLARVLLPALLLAGIVAVGLALFNNYVLPETNYAYARLIGEIQRKRPTAQIREGVMIDDFRGYHLFIGSLDDRSGQMRDVLILDGKDNPQSPRTILARAGTLDFRAEENTLVLRLKDGQIHQAEVGSPDGNYRWLLFDEQVMRIQDAGDLWRQQGEHRRNDRELSIPDMERRVAKIRKDRGEVEAAISDRLETIGLRRIAELDSIDPATAQPQGYRRLSVAIRKAIGRTPPTRPTPFGPEQQREVDLVRAREREIQALDREISKYQVEIQKKLAIPVACVVLLLVGAPVGMLARRGGVTVGFFSVVFFLFYYLCLVGGETLADRQLLAPWLAMWGANLILGPMGVWLTLRAVRSGQPARTARGDARR